MKKYRTFKEVQNIAYDAIPFLGRKLPLSIGINNELYEKLINSGLNKKESLLYGEIF